jgi:hypothetical protein
MEQPVLVQNVRQPTSRTFSSNIAINKTLSEKLFDALASFKVKTSSVAMHLADSWRLGFFRQLDSLLEEESWDPADAPPTSDSFTTLLRMLLFLAPERRPGLGATSQGNFVAAWTVGNDRLTIEALPKDRVRWVVSCELNGAREAAAGSSTLSNLGGVLSPYNPDRWFCAQRLPRA